jgi:hypothetical protein
METTTTQLACHPALTLMRTKEQLSIGAHKMMRLESEPSESGMAPESWLLPRFLRNKINGTACAHRSMSRSSNAYEQRARRTPTTL